VFYLLHQNRRPQPQSRLPTDLIDLPSGAIFRVQCMGAGHPPHATGTSNSQRTGFQPFRCYHSSHFTLQFRDLNFISVCSYLCCLCTKCVSTCGLDISHMEACGLHPLRSFHLQCPLCRYFRLGCWLPVLHRSSLALVVLCGRVFICCISIACHPSNGISGSSHHYLKSWSVCYYLPF